jgi:hypothetical protein
MGRQAKWTFLRLATKGDLRNQTTAGRIDGLAGSLTSAYMVVKMQLQNAESEYLNWRQLNVAERNSVITNFQNGRKLV